MNKQNFYAVLPGGKLYYQSSKIHNEYETNLPLKVFKLETIEEAQSAPTPATIFSLFLDGKFVTSDISVCMDSRFDKIVGKH